MNHGDCANTTNPMIREGKIIISVHYSDSGLTLQNCIASLLSSHMWKNVKI